MSAPVRLRFAACLAVAAVSGGALGACGQNTSQGNNGATAGGTQTTSPSTLQGQGKTQPAVTQTQHSVTSTQPSGTVTQPATTLGKTNGPGG